MVCSPESTAIQLSDSLAANEFECLLWIRGKVSPRRRYVGVSFFSQNRNRCIAKGRHHVRNVPDPNVACIVAHRHVPHIMNPVR